LTTTKTEPIKNQKRFNQKNKNKLINKIEIPRIHKIPVNVIAGY
jgi:hypothetical protein